MIGDHWIIPLGRQKEIIKIAHRKRRYLDVWQRQQVAIWRRALDMNKTLPEQQRFFMRNIETILIRRGYLQPQQDTLI